MNFSALSIRNPIPAIMLFVLLTVAGLMAFNASKVQDFPDIELPIVTVTAVLDGAAPAQLETEVARKIEDSVATLQGIKNIYTRVLDGVATVTVEFILERDSAEAVNDVRDAVSRVRADMPAELREPTVTKAATAGRVVSTFTIAAAEGSGLDDQDLSWFVDNDVAKRMLGVPGLGEIRRVGGVTREMRVELDDQKMAALRVSALDISRQLRNVQREAPPAIGAHAGHRRHRAGAGRDGDPAAGRTPRAPGPGGACARHRGRAPRAGRTGWPPRRRLRSVPHARGRRDRCRHRRARRDGTAQERKPEADRQ
jgi:multidrug efflux pump subunit AcrB